MENKVIAKEYVDKNYVHKDVIREILKKYANTEVDDTDKIIAFYREIKEKVEDK